MTHEFPISLKDEWLTPPSIIHKLGEFDLDPCSPINPPWSMAKSMLTVNDNGLLISWFGRVWLNPPYGKNISAWLNRMALHDNGIALVFARTETQWFHQYIWPFANGMLFLKNRITFFNVDGTPGKSNAGAPSVLISYGNNNKSLEISGIPGKFINLMDKYFILVMDYSGKTWKLIVEEALNTQSGSSDLKNIYDMVIRLAPNKIRNNKHFKAKIRQTLQLHFKRVGVGVWSK